MKISTDQILPVLVGSAALLITLDKLGGILARTFPGGRFAHACAKISSAAHAAQTMIATVTPIVAALGAKSPDAPKDGAS